MLIHKNVISKNQVNYYFTKDKDNCLLIEYNPNRDYPGTSSGPELLIQIHDDNAFLVDNFQIIELKEVPQRIIQLLSFISGTDKQ
jgi:hypothetical protein